MPKKATKSEKKKKKGAVIRPWCWYCERDFEDEKVLMQHQKAKHFKCNHCPRRLNTAGGLAVHIQQVHKLEPERIENALPGRDGYDVEIFGMEGIPAPDLADYKRRKETELGLAPGSTSVPPSAKRPKIDKRVMSQAELASMLAAHKALMSGAELPVPPPMASVGPQIGAPVAYGAPPVPFPGPPPGVAPPPGFASLPPGMSLPPVGAGMPFPPPPGVMPPMGFPGGPPPFPGGPPPFPGGMPPPGMGFPPPGMMISPPGAQPGPPVFPPPPPAQSSSVDISMEDATEDPEPPARPPPVPTPTFAPVSKAQYARQPDIKDGAKLVWADPDVSPEETRSKLPKFSQPYANAAPEQTVNAVADGPRGVKRARAEDFL